MTDYKYPQAINDMIALFKTLPGVGDRGAARMVFAILKWKPEKQQSLGHLIAEINERLAPCPECGNISEKNSSCRYCTDLSRDSKVICLVEEATQIPSLEASGLFKGLYHVLGGRIAPLEGKTAQELNIESLLQRIDKHQVKEIILALGQDVEGQATAIYISDKLKDKAIKVSRLARGLPAGSDIAYADAATIAAALNGRTPLQ